MRLQHIYVTPRSSLAKEKKVVLFWQNGVANQLTFSPFLLYVFYCYITKRSIFQLICNPNLPEQNLVFLFFAILFLGVTTISMVSK